MTKFSVNTFICVSLCFGGTSLSNLAYGQVKDIRQTEIRASSNPFDYTLDLLENPVVEKPVAGLALRSYVRPSTSQLKVAPQKQQVVNSQKQNAVLQYRKQINGGAVQAENLIAGLTAKYGAPKSVRGNNYVWEVDNPAQDSLQANVVTIIVTVNEKGKSELVMDRNRGEDGRATWAVPKLKAEQNKSVQASKKSQAPILEENPN